MANIKNNPDLAAEIARKISSAAADLTLIGDASTQQVACVHVSAEDDCNMSFQEGSAYLVQLQKHISHLTDYIMQISDTLEKADGLSVKSSQGVSWNTDVLIPNK